jgi:transcriptional regulator with XRE-family HTH domain
VPVAVRAMKTKEARLTRTRHPSTLRVILASRGITQRRLARDLRLQYMLVHRIVKGELLPAPKVAERIAQYLNETHEVLFADEGDSR